MAFTPRGRGGFGGDRGGRGGSRGGFGDRGGRGGARGGRGQSYLLSAESFAEDTT